MSVKFFDVDYELDSRFTRGLRYIFEKDDKFVYNKNQEKSDVIITCQYPENTDTVDKIPHIVIESASFENNIQNAFGYNYYRDIPHKDFKNGARQYAYIIPYGVTIRCVGQQSIAKDLASRVHWWIAFGATQYFNEQLGLQIQSIQKGGVGPSRQYPQKVFEGIVSLRGTLCWLATKRPEDAMIDLDTPLKGVKVTFN